MSSAPRVLVAHALEASGDEGILGDAAVVQEIGGRPCCVATGLLTAASRGAPLFEELPSPLVERQIEAALLGGGIAAARVGIAGGDTTIARLGYLLRTQAPETGVLAPAPRPAQSAAGAVPRTTDLDAALLTAARVLVVRIGDCEALGLPAPGSIEDLGAAARALRARGARAVLIAGYVSRGRVIDLLDDEGSMRIFDATRVLSAAVPGLPGAHATALAAHLALGASLTAAAEAAQRYVGMRLRRGR